MQSNTIRLKKVRFEMTFETDAILAGFTAVGVVLGLIGGGKVLMQLAGSAWKWIGGMVR